ncbi:hypothetical protein, partial [Streptosporangium canum]|uniref:hypothetical protein n=1 Tax=Streptosporangium canum TaxID=324952 RepID=UPI0033A452DF
MLTARPSTTFIDCPHDAATGSCPAGYFSPRVSGGDSPTSERLAMVDAMNGSALFEQGVYGQEDGWMLPAPGPDEWMRRLGALP